jgi:hypothetical protein
MNKLTEQRDRIRAEIAQVEADRGALHDYADKLNALRRELAYTIELITELPPIDRETCAICGHYDTPSGDATSISVVRFSALVCAWCQTDHIRNEWYVGYRDAADEGPFETREEAEEYAAAQPGGKYDVAIVGNYGLETT